MDQVAQIVVALRELEEDSTTPKSVRVKVSTTIKLLSAESELSIRKSRALDELQEIGDDINVPAHTKMQVFNIVSLLESV